MFTEHLPVSGVDKTELREIRIPTLGVEKYSCREMQEQEEQANFRVWEVLSDDKG